MLSIAKSHCIDIPGKLNDILDFVVDYNRLADWTIELRAGRGPTLKQGWKPDGGMQGKTDGNF